MSLPRARHRAARGRAAAWARASLVTSVLLVPEALLASEPAIEPVAEAVPLIASPPVAETQGSTAAATANPRSSTGEPIATPVSGATAPLRIAVVDLPDPEITARLVAELRFLGFAPEVVPPPATSDPAALLALARRSGAAAAISVDMAGGRVQVWIVDRITGKLVARQLALDPEPAAADEPREIAVRSVELLRASLLEVEHAPPPPEAEVPVTPAARRTLRRPRPRFGAAAAIAVGGAPGGLPVAVHARAHVRYMPHPYVGVILTGTAPLHAVEVSAAEGSARIRTGWLGLGPRVALRPPDATVVPDLTATAGPVFVTMDGTPSPSHVGTRALVVDAIFEANAGLEIALSPRVRLRLEAGAGTCARTVRVRFAGRPVATWCRPHALGSLGIGVVGW